MFDMEKLRFDPEEGITVREPPGQGYGYWAGGMKAAYDPDTRKFYLFYRQRVPLERGRGGRCAIAESEDGIHFRDIWSATKEDFLANSIEVGCPVKDPAGGWRLYVSYEYAEGDYWRVDVLQGETLADLDVQARRTVMLPQDYGLSFVKDPVVYIVDGRYHVYVCGSPRQRYRVEEDGTIVTIGHDATLLMVSDDGLHFPRARYVFEPTGEGWDGMRARINCLIPMEDGYAVFYDGGAGFYDNYEEWCGLAYSPDGVTFTRLTKEGPWVRSRYGCVRYVYGLRVEDTIYCYYEYTRPDLSHELRVSKIELG
ncbi:MAG TPA: hypothetical protein G4O02_12350 [Caldilineae bacterium]|nr:hypothetical protein [Caldilineae bacterium]